MKRLTVAVFVAAVLVVSTPTRAHADTKWRDWEDLQTGEVVVCYGPGDADTFKTYRRPDRDKLYSLTRCEQNAYGFRNGRWIEWHDRQTGEILWCYGGVRVRPIEGARPGAQWAKCADRNIGKVR